METAWPGDTLVVHFSRIQLNRDYAVSDDAIVDRALEVVEGVIVYLPVNQPGALLYVGDGHAAQGDGELNGNALETSMDVEFTVDVIHDKRIRTPRMEADSQIITIGLGGSLEDTLRMQPAASRNAWSKTTD
jgi:acetamidase/formamidase